MNCDIHNVLSITSTVKRRTPDDSRKPYFVHTMVVTTLAYTGETREESLTFYSNNDDERQITLFPPEAE